MISLLESFVEQLGGCVIPLPSVIYGGSFSSLGPDSVSQNQSFCHEVKKTFCTSGPLFPSKTVMDFFLAGKTKKSSDFNLAQYHCEGKTTHSGTTALMCSSGKLFWIAFFLLQLLCPCISAGLLIFHAVAGPQNSGKSEKLREIHKNTRNTVKFARNHIKYMSVHHI